MLLRSFGLGLALAAAFLLGTLVPSGSAQNQGNRILRIDYMKIPPGQRSQYLSLEKDLWRPVHAKRLERGYINSWALYGNHLPGGPVEYQYITVTALPSFAALENLDERYAELFAEVHGAEDYEKVRAQTEQSRSMVKTELWVLQDSVP